MSENRGQRLPPAIEQRYLAFARDQRLACPLCPKTVNLTGAGHVTLRVFDEFHGHLLNHDVMEWATAVRDARG